MRSLSRSFAFFAFVGLVAVPALPAMAAETAASEFVIVRSGSTIEGDLYAGGVKVRIEGTVDGDLLAAAAEEIVISGTVTGSVLAIAPTVIVTGTVEGSLRVLGRSLDLEGTIGGDVVHAAGSSKLGASSQIAGEVLAWTGSLESLGEIGMDLSGNVGDLELAGVVGRDVDVSVSSLAVVDSLEVGGDVGYRSNREATGLSNAEVGGATVQKTPLPQNIRVRALGFLGRFLLAIFLTVSAITVVYSWPNHTKAAVGQVESKPVRSWLFGLGVFLLPAILAGLAVLILALAPSAAALPLLVVMIPLLLATSGVVLLLALFAGVPAVTWLGARMRSGLTLNGAVAVGSAVAALLWFVPAIGWLVPLIALPMGMGAWMLSWQAAGA